jgi:phage terminase large subunit
MVKKNRVVQRDLAFKKMWTNKDKRYIILTGGRGSLKSTHVHYFIHDLTYEKGHGILFTRYYMTSAENSIIPEFKTILERMGTLSDFDIRKTKITNKITGSFILFSGIKTPSGDQTATLKSIAGITTWVMEEGEDFPNDEKKFDDINKSIRTASKQNRIIWIQNPSTRHHLIYQMFFKDAQYKKNYHGFDVTMSNHHEVLHIHTTYHIAVKYLNKTILNEYERDRKKALNLENKYKSRYYQRYIGGWRDKAEGVIFENWIEGDFDFLLPYCVGLDYGMTDPTAVVRVSVDKYNKKIYVQELIYQTDLSNESLLKLLESKTEINELIVTDHNEKRTNKYLSQHGINVKKAKKNKIAQDIRELQDYTIVVTPDSKNIKIELNEYAWNDKKADLPIDDWNHAIDAIRYAFVKLTYGRTLST